MQIQHTIPLSLLLSLSACTSDVPDTNTSRAMFAVENVTAVLELANTAALAVLDDDVGLDKRAAKNIVAMRPYSTLAELDAVPFVGKKALSLLDAFVDAPPTPAANADASVLFSPLPLSQSHNARIADLIDDATQSVDIAIYSYSSKDISDAIEDAIGRGLPVRVIFETARKDDNIDDEDKFFGSKSARLEALGADVRFVNKIMHHKFAIVDGPRDFLDDAATATVISGSANMSTGGATIYDENTVFLSNNEEAALSFQREFNLLWDHSRDFAAFDIEFDPSGVEITAFDIVDDPDFALHVTSDNFNIKEGSTTFRVDRDSMVGADAWVEAIESAQSQILIASGHLRLRPVAEALIAKQQANPDMDIRVYLDQQEFVSAFTNNKQKDKVETCLEKATSAKKEFDCLNKSFLWGRDVGNAGVDVRYKTYALRWHFSYAKQMHHKFMIVDGERLLTGSYNLSINAEHNTFENIMDFSAPTYAALVDEYVAEFEDIWTTGDGLLGDLRDDIKESDVIPLVFQSMALTESQVTSLRSLIRKNCKQADSESFRKNPEKHKVCFRS